MNHAASAEDGVFRSQFETCELPPPFDHRDHVRLAYVNLTERGVDASHISIEQALFRYLDHHGVDRMKYHETLTRAWILAVRNFMEICPDSSSADSFLDKQPRLLNSKIMLKHYSEELLFSEQARIRFVEPDLIPIPRYTD